FFCSFVSLFVFCFFLDSAHSDIDTLSLHDALPISKLLAPDIVTDNSLTMPMGYKSVWSYGVGLQYDLNSRIQLRMGYEPRKSSIPDDRRSVQAPLGDANLYSIGMGY